MVDNKERIILQRGSSKAYTIIPLDDLESYVSEPNNSKAIERGLNNIKEGKISVVDPMNIWKDID